MLPSEFWALSAAVLGRFPTASGSALAGSLSCGKVGAVSQLLGSHWIAAAGFPIARVGWWTVFAGSLAGSFRGVTQCWNHNPGSWAAQLVATQLVGLMPKLLVSKTWLKILGLNNKCGACLLHEISGHATLWFQGYVPGLILLHIMSKDSNYFFSLLIWENGNCFADIKFCTFYIPRVVQITLEVVLKTVYFSFALQYQMKERTIVMVQNSNVIVLLMARLWEPTRLIHLKGEIFFLAAKMVQRFILLVLP